MAPFRALAYFFEEAVQSLWRSRLLNALSVLTIAVSLFVLGAFLAVAGNLSEVVTRWTRLVQWVEAKRADRRTYWLFRADARDWNRLREPPPALTNAGWWARCSVSLVRVATRWCSSRPTLVVARRTPCWRSTTCSPARRWGS